jgi:hypothetical protein
MNHRDPTLPTRAVVRKLLNKYDKVEPFDNDDLHWMVNVLHVLNDDPEYQKHQDELEESGVDVVTAPHEEKPSINIAPQEDSEKPEA